MTTWNLQGTTELTSAGWPDLVHLLAGWRAAWVDLDGMHIDVDLPTALPITSHLWAWTSGGWLRVRVDGDRWWAGALFRGEAPGSGLWGAKPDTVEDVTVHLIRSWSPTEGRTAQRRLAAGAVPPTMRQLVPVRARPAVYIGSSDSPVGG